MPFTLRLGFGGLCLFAHDQQNGRMHVIFPSDSEHKPRLTHDSESTGAEKPTGKPSHRYLENTFVDLTALETTSSHLGAPPDDVANLTNCVIRRKIVEDLNPGEEKITTRITFAAGKARVERCGEGASWEFGAGARKRLPVRVVWELEIADPHTSISIPRLGLNGHPGRKPLKLNQHHGELNIWFSNTPQGHLPKKLPPKTIWNELPKAPHFGHYYTLLGDCTGPIPEAGRAPAFDKKCYIKEDDNKGYDLTCIAARVAVVP